MINSSITSIPETQCAIRAILHREYELIVEEAGKHNERLPKYLVAPHLSGKGSVFSELDTRKVLQNRNTPISIRRYSV